jgi:hypothetical protein
MAPTWKRPSAIGRAFRAGVADQVQHVLDRGAGLVRRDGERRILTGGGEDAVAGMRIGAVLHPTVLLALEDGTCLLQHGDRPAARGPDRWPPITPAGRILWSVPRSGLLTQGRNSELAVQRLFYVFRRAMHNGG